MAMKTQRNLGKRKVMMGAEKIKMQNSGKKRTLMADKIGRKYLRKSLVLRKCHLAQPETVQRKQIVEHPATMKLLLKSHVSYSFSMPLPAPFCRKYLPSEDTIMVLETYTGEQYEVKYLPRACRLSGGWGRFAMDKKLEPGDVIVFHLVAATKFKVLWKCQLVQVKRLQPKLNTEHPAFVKYMQKTYSSGQSLALPGPFCRAYLPEKDTIMVLETETGEQYEIKYVSRFCALTSGWRKFSMDKKLEAGDAIVFHLVAATKFKVCFIRENSSTEIILPFPLHSSVSHLSPTVSSKVDSSNQLIVYRRADSKVHEQTAENHNWKSARLLNLRNPGDSMFFHEEIPFSKITSFEEFKLVLQKLLQNNKLPPYNILHDYYELCFSQNAFLHAHLFKGINPNKSNYQIIIIEAIRRIIYDTVNLANALRTSKLSTFLHKHALWEKALKEYEALGMNVGFLHARLHHLKNLAFSSEGTVFWNQYKEASLERGRAEGEARKLEKVLAQLQTKTLKVEPLKENCRGACSWLACAKAEIRNLEVLHAELGKFFSEYDAHIETLKLKAKTHEVQFQEEASAPW